MAKTVFTEYRFIVKEGQPPESGGEAPTFLMCEPLTPEPSFLGEKGFITIALKKGISVQDAQKIAEYFEGHVSGLGFTTF